MEQKKNEKLLREIKQKKKGDYHSILGLQSNCSYEDVRRAFMKLSLKVHPDKNKSPEADQVFKIVSEAYQRLIEQRKFPHERKTHSCWDMQPNFNWEEKNKPEPQSSGRTDFNWWEKKKSEPDSQSSGLTKNPEPISTQCEICGASIYGYNRGICEYCEEEGDYEYDECFWEDEKEPEPNYRPSGAGSTKFNWKKEKKPKPYFQSSGRTEFNWEEEKEPEPDFPSSGHTKYNWEEEKEPELDSQSSGRSEFNWEEEKKPEPDSQSPGPRPQPKLAECEICGATMSGDDCNARVCAFCE